MTQKINYVRLSRETTDSWITYHLPKPLPVDENLEKVLEEIMPGWEFETGSVFNPDE